MILTLLLCSTTLLLTTQAGKYVKGARGANVCSGGLEKISDDATCRVAAREIGFKYTGTANQNGIPSGCVLMEDIRNGDNVFFNKHTTGEGDSYMFPVCQNKNAPDTKRVLRNYLRGVQGTNVCSGGSEKISDEIGCKAAAAELGIKFFNSETDSSVPSGCYMYYQDRAYFNKDPNGAEDSYATPLCIDQPRKYYKGMANTNACELGSKRIDDVATCTAAAQELGKTYKGTVTDYWFPKGCYEYYSSEVYLNINTDGYGHEKSNPICLVVQSE